MKWVIVRNDGDQSIFGRVDDDGLMRVTCSAEYPEFIFWVAEGNTAEEWEA